MTVRADTTYTSSSKLHQRCVLAIDGVRLTYRVVSTHCADNIGMVVTIHKQDFERWAKAVV